MSCRLIKVGSRQSAVGRIKVASRKSQVASGVAFGDVIGYWLLVIGDRALALLWAGMNSRFQKIALQSNAYQNSSLFTLHSSLKKQRKPKPFTIHHSPFTISWDSNPTLQKLFTKKKRCKATHTKILTPHSSLLTFHRESSR